MGDVWGAMSGEHVDPDLESSAYRRSVENGNGPDSFEQRQFHVLYQEYQRAIGLIEAQWDRILRVAAIGFSAASALILLIASETLDQNNRWIYWIAPVMIALLYALAIQMMYHMSFASYYARDLEDDIAERAGIPYFHLSSATARGLTSVRTGNPPLQATYGLCVLFALVIYLVVFGVCFDRLRSVPVPVWESTTYVFVQMFVSGTLLWATIGSARSLRQEYERWKAVSSEAAAELLPRYKRAELVWRLLGYAFLPRPVEFCTKSLATIAAFGVTSLILGITQAPDLLKVGIGVVVCVDFLAKQATYIWNDILDVDLDRRHPHKSTTRVLTDLPTDAFGKILFLFRTIAAFAAAFVLGNLFGLTWLPWLIAGIYVWQFVYDRWAKRSPARRVLFAAAGYAERAIAGSLAAMTLADTFDGFLLILVAIWVIVFMTIVLAEFWWAERTYVRDKKYPAGTTVRVWLIEKGRRLQHAANLILVVVTMAIVYFYNGAIIQPLQPLPGLVREARQASLNFSNAVQQFADDGFSPISAVFGFPQLSPAQTNGAVLILVVLGVFSTFFVQRKLDQSSPERRSRWVAWLGCTGAVLLFIAPPNWRFVVVAFFIPLLVAAYMEHLSYPEIIKWEKLLHMKLPRAIPAIEHLLFDPWAIRVAIRPVGQSLGVEVSSGAERLARLYEGWGRHNGLRSCRSCDDGNGPYDVVIAGPYPKLGQLLDETGRHECVESASSGVCTEHAYVYVMPLAAPPHFGLGTGLDVPNPPDNVLASDTSAVRTYQSNVGKLVGFSDDRKKPSHAPKPCPPGSFNGFLEWVVAGNGKTLFELEPEWCEKRCQ